MKSFLAVFIGSKTGEKSKKWFAMREDERKKKEEEGGAAWGAWMQKNHGSLVFSGGPLGSTKLVDERGAKDTVNGMGAFVVIKAESHEEATKLFIGHPHFMIFPGDGVEVMEVMPTPGKSQ